MSVGDYWSTSTSTPTLDASLGGTSDVLQYAGQEQNGVTTIKFVRLLLTGDSKTDTSITEGQNSVIVAFQPSYDSLSYDHGSHRATLHLNFFTGTGLHACQLRLCFIVSVFCLGSAQDVVEVMQPSHGILMTLGWGVCVPTAVILARYFKHIGHRWFIGHVSLNVLGLLCILSGFILSFLMVTPFSFSTSVAAVHAYIGVITVSLGMLVQPILGWLADRMWDPERKEVPMFPDKLHSWAGRVSMALAWCEIATGLYVYGAATVWWAVCAAWLAILCLTTVVLEVRSRREKPEEEPVELRSYSAH